METQKGHLINNGNALVSTGIAIVGAEHQGTIQVVKRIARDVLEHPSPGTRRR